MVSGSDTKNPLDPIVPEPDVEKRAQILGRWVVQHGFLMFGDLRPAQSS
jgi:hypothetical protein